MAKTGFGHVFLDVACSLLLKKCSEWHRKRKIKNITQVVPPPHIWIASWWAKKLVLRWLDWIFLGGYFPSLSINYVGMSKDMEKWLPQLYYIKMKISSDLGFIAIGVAVAT